MRTISGPSTLVATAVAIAGLGAASPHAAAQAQQSGASASESTVQLEEVLVTARKREESLQDVPLTVSAITASAIEELRIQRPDDIARFTPAFSYVSSFGRLNSERPVVRGQSNILGAANASFFVDGVYVSGPAVSTETSNLERIEVIKGPQAALYGRATFAGAINYITKRPGNDFEGKANVTFAENGEEELGGSISGPIVDDKLFYYASVRSWEYGGEYTNAIDGKKADQQSTDSGTLKFLWTPTEGVEVTLFGTISKDDDDGALPLALQGREFNNCQLRVLRGTAANNFAGSEFPRSPGYFCGEVLGADDLTVRQRTDVMQDPGLERTNKRGALTVKWTFGDGYELTSISGYHDENQETQVDVSYDGYDAFVQIFGPTQSGAFWRRGEESRDDFSQELKIRSPAERRFRWLAGAYYFSANDDLTRDDKFLPPGSPLANGPGCYSLGVSRLCPNGQGNLREVEIENKAVFADVEFDFTDKFTATLEARYAEENQEQKNITVLPPSCNPMTPTATGGFFDACTFTGEFKSTTPRVTLRYKATEDQTYYLNWAQGNKPGGFNTASAVLTGISTGVPVAPVYDEEESDAIELGAKWILFDNRVRLNTALFYTEVTGQQLTSNIIGTLNGNAVVNSYVANIGKTEIKGIELDGQWRVSENFDLRGTFSWLESTIKEFVDNNQANLYSPIGAFQPTQSLTTVTLLCNVRGSATQVPGRPFCDDAQNADIATYGSVAGNGSPRVPDIQASLIGTWTQPLGDTLTLRVSGDVSYEDSKFAQVDNLAETGAHTYIGLRIGLETEHWDVSLWGKNLTDDDTALDILRYIDTEGITAAQYATQFGRIQPRGFALTLPRGRQIGVSAAYRF